MSGTLWSLAQRFAFTELGWILGPICSVLVLMALWAAAFLISFVAIRACAVVIFILRGREPNDREMRKVTFAYFFVEFILWLVYLCFVYCAAGGLMAFISCIVSILLSGKLLDEIVLPSVKDQKSDTHIDSE